MARDKNIEMLLSVIRGYFEPMRKDRGAMRTWCRENKIGQWNLARILRNDPNYEPKMRIINRFIEGMIGHSPIEIRGTLIDKSQDMSKADLVRKFAKGLAEVEMPDVQYVYQLIDVLSYKNLLNGQYPQFLQTLLSLLLTLHVEIIKKLAEKEAEKDSLPLIDRLMPRH